MPSEPEGGIKDDATDIARHSRDWRAAVCRPIACAPHGGTARIIFATRADGAPDRIAVPQSAGTVRLAPYVCANGRSRACEGRCSCCTACCTGRPFRASPARRSPGSAATTADCVAPLAGSPRCSTRRRARKDGSARHRTRRPTIGAAQRSASARRRPAALSLTTARVRAPMPAARRAAAYPISLRPRTGNRDNRPPRRSLVSLGLPQVGAEALLAGMRGV
jgi:hypothetical protein